MRIFFFKDEEKKKKLKVMSLPHWPTPAGQEQRDVPWLHSDTFIITKNNNSSEKKTWPTKADRRVEGTRPG